MSILLELAYRRQRIECAEILLERSAAPALSIKGPGMIWVDDGGQITFEFKVTPDQYQPYVKARLQKPRPIPDEPKAEDYHELTAVTGSGQFAALRSTSAPPKTAALTDEGGSFNELLEKSGLVEEQHHWY